MIRNNSVLPDDAVRQAGGLVLELWVALIVREKEEEEESKVVGCFYNFHTQYH